MMKETVLLTMTSSNDLPPGSQGTVERTEEREDNDAFVAINLTSHSGLSALLSAVTLQLSESNEEEQKSSNINSKKHEASIDVSSMTAGEAPMDETLSEEEIPKKSLSAAPSIIVPKTAKTFPQTLMSLLMSEDNINIITFLPDNQFFALRADAFSSTLMHQHFSIPTWESFLERLTQWGFLRIETNLRGIEVFRHPSFRKGDWEQCERMTSVASSTETASAVDPKVDRIAPEGSKRRLSPAHVMKATPSNVKVRIHTDITGESSEHKDPNVPLSPQPPAPDAHSVSGSRRRKLSDSDCKSLAINFATEKFDLEQTGDADANLNMPLASQAVFGATHTIVSDAIETLLRDEDHTRRTFQKHAEKLSKSSLPGLVPISKQLFCSPSSPTPTENYRYSSTKLEELRRQQQELLKPRAPQHIVSSPSPSSSSPQLLPSRGTSPKAAGDSKNNNEDDEKLSPGNIR